MSQQGSREGAETCTRYIDTSLPFLFQVDSKEAVSQVLSGVKPQAKKSEKKTEKPKEKEKSDKGPEKGKKGVMPSSGYSVIKVSSGKGIL